MKVVLRLRTSATVYPAELTVRNFDGTLIFYKRFIKPCDVYSFPTRKRNLIITVRPLSDDYAQISKFFVFEKIGCVFIDLLLPFEKIGRSVENFSLTDLHYGMPVKTATLFFNSAY